MPPRKVRKCGLKGKRIAGKAVGELDLFKFPVWTPPAEALHKCGPPAALPDPVPFAAPGGGKVADARAAQLMEPPAARRRRLAGLAPRAAGSTPGRRTVSAAKAPTLRLLEWRHLSTSVVAPLGDDRGGKAAGAQVPRRRKVRAPEAKRSWAADNSWDDSFLEWSWGESAARARTEEVPGAKRARHQAVPGAKRARHRRQPSRPAGTKLEEVDSTNRTKIAERLRFHTSESGDEQISLEEYIGRMKENQNDIFYITGQSIATVSASPSLITLRKRGVEVLYVVDPVNQFCVQHLKEFGGKKLKSTTREELNESGGKKLKSTTKKEMLHMFDPVDAFCVQQLKEFGIKKLKSTPSEDTLHMVDPIDENCAQQVKESGDKKTEVLHEGWPRPGERGREETVGDAQNGVRPALR